MTHGCSCEACSSTGDRREIEHDLPHGARERVPRLVRVVEIDDEGRRLWIDRMSVLTFNRRRSVIVRKNSVGEKLSSARVANDPAAIARKILMLVYYRLRDGEIRCLAKPA